MGVRGASGTVKVGKVTTLSSRFSFLKLEAFVMYVTLDTPFYMGALTVHREKEERARLLRLVVPTPKLNGIPSAMV